MIFVDEFPDPGFDPGFDPGVDPTMSSSGIPGWFVAIFLLMLVFGVGTWIWRINTARGMATRAGLDPDEATTVTMLGESGLEATYLASNLRQQHEPPPAAAAPRPTAERLAELEKLRTSGAITEAEYADRRKAVIDTI